MSTDFKPKVPEGLRELIKELTRNILKEKPGDIYDFAERFFQSHRKEKENCDVKNVEFSSHKYDFAYKRITQCHNIVYSVMPDGLAVLIKDLIKAVLREQPSNLNEFAAEYLLHLRTSSKLSNFTRNNYRPYDKQFLNKDSFAFSPFWKCTCGRTFGEGFDNILPMNHNSSVRGCREPRTEGKRETPAEHSASIKSNDNEKEITYSKNHIHSAYAIQRYFRSYIERKHSSKLTQSPMNVISEETEIIKLRDHAKAAQEVLPAVQQLQLGQHENNNMPETTLCAVTPIANHSAFEPGQEVPEGEDDLQRGELCFQSPNNTNPKSSEKKQAITNNSCTDENVTHDEVHGEDKVKIPKNNDVLPKYPSTIETGFSVEDTNKENTSREISNEAKSQIKFLENAAQKKDTVPNIENQSIPDQTTDKQEDKINNNCTALDESQINNSNTDIPTPPLSEISAKTVSSSNPVDKLTDIHTKEKSTSLTPTELKNCNKITNGSAEDNDSERTSLNDPDVCTCVLADTTPNQLKSSGDDIARLHIQEHQETKSSDKTSEKSEKYLTEISQSQNESGVPQIDPLEEIPTRPNDLEKNEPENEANSLYSTQLENTKNQIIIDEQRGSQHDNILNTLSDTQHELKSTRRAKSDAQIQEQENIKEQVENSPSVSLEEVQSKSNDNTKTKLVQVQTDELNLPVVNTTETHILNNQEMPIIQRQESQSPKELTDIESNMISSTQTDNEQERIQSEIGYIADTPTPDSEQIRSVNAYESEVDKSSSDSQKELPAKAKEPNDSEVKNELNTPIDNGQDILKSSDEDTVNSHTQGETDNPETDKYSSDSLEMKQTNDTLTNTNSHGIIESKDDKNISAIETFKLPSVNRIDVSHEYLNQSSADTSNNNAISNVSPTKTQDISNEDPHVSNPAYNPTDGKQILDLGNGSNKNSPVSRTERVNDPSVSATIEKHIKPPTKANSALPDQIPIIIKGKENKQKLNNESPRIDLSENIINIVENPIIASPTDTNCPSPHQIPSGMRTNESKQQFHNDNSHVEGMANDTSTITWPNTAAMMPIIESSTETNFALPDLIPNITETDESRQIFDNENSHFVAEGNISNIVEKPTETNFMLACQFPNIMENKGSKQKQDYENSHIDTGEKVTNMVEKPTIESPAENNYDLADQNISNRETKEKKIKVENEIPQMSLSDMANGPSSSSTFNNVGDKPIIESLNENNHALPDQIPKIMENKESNQKLYNDNSHVSLSEMVNDSSTATNANNIVQKPISESSKETNFALPDHNATLTEITKTKQKFNNENSHVVLSEDVNQILEKPIIESNSKEKNNVLPEQIFSITETNEAKANLGNESTNFVLGDNLNSIAGQPIIESPKETNFACPDQVPSIIESKESKQNLSNENSHIVFLEMTNDPFTGISGNNMVKKPIRESSEETNVDLADQIPSTMEGTEIKQELENESSHFDLGEMVNDRPSVCSTNTVVEMQFIESSSENNFESHNQTSSIMEVKESKRGLDNDNSYDGLGEKIIDSPTATCSNTIAENPIMESSTETNVAATTANKIIENPLIESPNETNFALPDQIPSFIETKESKHELSNENSHIGLNEIVNDPCTANIANNIVENPITKSSKETIVALPDPIPSIMETADIKQELENERSHIDLCEIVNDRSSEMHMIESSNETNFAPPDQISSIVETKESKRRLYNENSNDCLIEKVNDAPTATCANTIDDKPIIEPSIQTNFAVTTANNIIEKPLVESSNETNFALSDQTTSSIGSNNNIVEKSITEPSKETSVTLPDQIPSIMETAEIQQKLETDSCHIDLGEIVNHRSILNSTNNIVEMQIMESSKKNNFASPDQFSSIMEAKESKPIVDNENSYVSLSKDVNESSANACPNTKVEKTIIESPTENNFLLPEQILNIAETKESKSNLDIKNGNFVQGEKKDNIAETPIIEFSNCALPHQMPSIIETEECYKKLYLDNSHVSSTTTNANNIVEKTIVELSTETSAGLPDQIPNIMETKESQQILDNEYSHVGLFEMVNDSSAATCPNTIVEKPIIKSSMETDFAVTTTNNIVEKPLIESPNEINFALPDNIPSIIETQESKHKINNENSHIGLNEMVNDPSTAVIFNNMVEKPITESSKETRVAVETTEIKQKLGDESSPIDLSEIVNDQSTVNSPNNIVDMRIIESSNENKSSDQFSSIIEMKESKQILDNKNSYVSLVKEVNDSSTADGANTIVEKPITASSTETNVAVTTANKIIENPTIKSSNESNLALLDKIPSIIETKESKQKLDNENSHIDLSQIVNDPPNLVEKPIRESSSETSLALSDQMHSIMETKEIKQKLDNENTNIDLGEIVNDRPSVKSCNNIVKLQSIESSKENNFASPDQIHSVVETKESKQKIDYENAHVGLSEQVIDLSTGNGCNHSVGNDNQKWKSNDIVQGEIIHTHEDANVNTQQSHLVQTELQSVSNQISRGDITMVHIYDRGKQPTNIEIAPSDEKLENKATKFDNLQSIEITEKEVNQSDATEYGLSKNVGNQQGVWNTEDEKIKEYIALINKFIKSERLYSEYVNQAIKDTEMFNPPPMEIMGKRFKNVLTDSMQSYEKLGDILAQESLSGTTDVNSSFEVANKNRSPSDKLCGSEVNQLDTTEYGLSTNENDNETTVSDGDQVSSHCIGNKSAEAIIGKQNLPICRSKHINNGLIGRFSDQLFAETHLRSFWKENLMNNGIAMGNQVADELSTKSELIADATDDNNCSGIDHHNKNEIYLQYSLKLSPTTDANERKTNTDCESIEKEQAPQSPEFAIGSTIENCYLNARSVGTTTGDDDHRNSGHDVSTVFVGETNLSKTEVNTVPAKAGNSICNVDNERLPRYFHGLTPAESTQNLLPKRKMYKEPTAFTIPFDNKRRAQSQKPILQTFATNSEHNIQIDMDHINSEEQLDSVSPSELFEELGDIASDLEITKADDGIIRLNSENGKEFLQLQNNCDRLNFYSQSPEKALHTIIELSEPETPRTEQHSIQTVSPADGYLSISDKDSGIIGSSLTCAPKESLDNSDEFSCENMCGYKRNHPADPPTAEVGKQNATIRGNIYEYESDEENGRDTKSTGNEKLVKSALEDNFQMPIKDFDGKLERQDDSLQKAASSIQKAFRRYRIKKTVQDTEKDLQHIQPQNNHTPEPLVFELGVEKEAAVIIQKVFRKYLQKKWHQNHTQKFEVDSSDTKTQISSYLTLNSNKNIDEIPRDTNNSHKLLDSNQAAMIIQRSFRSHLQKEINNRKSDGGNLLSQSLEISNQNIGNLGGGTELEDFSKQIVNSPNANDLKLIEEEAKDVIENQESDILNGNASLSDPNNKDYQDMNENSFDKPVCPCNGSNDIELIKDLEINQKGNERQSQSKTEAFNASTDDPHLDKQNSIIDNIVSGIDQSENNSMLSDRTAAQIIQNAYRAYKEKRQKQPKINDIQSASAIEDDIGNDPTRNFISGIRKPSRLHFLSEEQAARIILKAIRHFIDCKKSQEPNQVSNREYQRKPNWYLGNEPIVTKSSLERRASEISFEETEAYVELVDYSPYVVGFAGRSLELSETLVSDRNSTASISDFNNTDNHSILSEGSVSDVNAYGSQREYDTMGITAVEDIDVGKQQRVRNSEGEKIKQIISMFLKSERLYSGYVNQDIKGIEICNPPPMEIVGKQFNNDLTDSMQPYEKLGNKISQESLSGTTDHTPFGVANENRSSSDSENETDDCLKISAVNLYGSVGNIAQIQHRWSFTSQIPNKHPHLDCCFVGISVTPINNNGTTLDTDEESIVITKLQYDEIRESSAESDIVICGEDTSELSKHKNSNEDFGNEGSTKKGSILVKSETIDEPIRYIEPPDYEVNSGSFFLDEATSENIRQKMMAYSLSESDSDLFEKKVRNVEISSIETKPQTYDDTNISTALVDNGDTSTETESTIASAVTKIQTGAEDYRVCKQLGRTSAASDDKSQHFENTKNKASFGNEAISESLEYLLQDAAARRLQLFYRKYRRQQQALKGERSLQHVATSMESTLAQKRSMLQRGDALRDNSTPDDSNNNSDCSQNEKGSAAQQIKTQPTNAPKNTSQGISVTPTRSRRIENNKMKWLAMRQNSMPVQIESEVFRVIFKQIRKQIKSADSETVKKRRNVIYD